MGILGLEFARLMQGGRGFGKFPLRQTRISVRIGLERKVITGQTLWRDGRGGMRVHGAGATIQSRLRIR
jgi:hypothetical protein